jgi:hypothetical protein
MCKIEKPYSRVGSCKVDNDLVCAGLTKHWQKPYAQVHQAQLSPDIVTQSILNSLRDQLQQFGNHPNKFIGHSADEFHTIAGAPLFRQTVDWMQV